MGDAFEPVRSAQAGADRRGAYDLWIRRGLLAVLLAVVVLALWNVFGQRSGTATARTATADLVVHAPTRVRTGLLFQAKISITAHVTMPKTTLILSSGWIDGLTMNTEEPTPSSQTSGPGGSLDFTLGKLQAGQTFVEYLDYQVNPTSFSSRPQTITVETAGTPVVSLHRTMTIIP
jgi:hypothetical protein